VKHYGNKMTIQPQKSQRTWSWTSRAGGHAGETSASSRSATLLTASRAGRPRDNLTPLCASDATRSRYQAHTHSQSNELRQPSTWLRMLQTVSTLCAQRSLHFTLSVEMCQIQYAVMQGCVRLRNALNASRRLCLQSSRNCKYRKLLRNSCSVCC